MRNSWDALCLKWSGNCDFIAAFNKLGQNQNGRQFADGISKTFSLMKIIAFLFKFHWMLFLVV